MIKETTIRRIRFGAYRTHSERAIYARRHRVVVYTPDETATKKGAKSVQAFIKLARF